MSKLYVINIDIDQKYFLLKIYGNFWTSNRHPFNYIFWDAQMNIIYKGTPRV